jgi:hypothetical protein
MPYYFRLLQLLRLFCPVLYPRRHITSFCSVLLARPVLLRFVNVSVPLHSSPHHIPISLSFATNHSSLPNPSLTFTSSDRPRLPPHLHPRRRRLQALSLTVAKPKQLADPIPALQLTRPLLASRTRTVHSPKYIEHPESEPRGPEGGRYERGGSRDGGEFGRQEHSGESAGTWA